MPTAAFYVDAPDINKHDGRAILDRLIPSIDDAIEAAVVLYRTTDVAKVIVCEFPSSKRIVTVFGERTSPRIQRRGP